MTRVYVVSSVYSNEDDGTGCEPKVFSDMISARKYFDKQLKLALDDFVGYDYVSQAGADFFYSHVENSDIESLVGNIGAVEKNMSLQYEVDGFGIEFWNDTDLSEYDFGYSINIHEVELN